MKKYYDDNARKFFCMICLELDKINPEIKNVLTIPEIVGHVNFRLGLELPYELAQLKAISVNVAEEIDLVYNDYYLNMNVGKNAFLMLVSRIKIFS